LEPSILGSGSETRFLGRSVRFAGIQPNLRRSSATIVGDATFGMLRPISVVLCPAWVLFLAASTLAQQPAPTSARPDPADLVRKAVQNEIKSSTDDNLRFMFRETKTTPRGSETKLFVETRDATAGLVVAYDGKPLTPEQRHAEEGRVARFLSNPEELKKKRKQERGDADRTLRIVRAMPDAFQFDYAGEEPDDPRLGKPGDLLVKLNFRPNPGYQPPSRIEQVLTGMRGVMFIDDARHRIARIDGTLFKDVAFGWGILGHLDKGGHFLVEQQEIGDHRWEISRISLDFTGRILLFKSLSIKSTEVFSDYKQVPSDLTFAQALELLKKEGATMAENSGKVAPE
jgi:hypothetical protein